MFIFIIYFMKMSNIFDRANNLFTNNFLIEDEALPDVNQVSSRKNSSLDNNDISLLQSLIRASQKNESPYKSEDIDADLKIKTINDQDRAESKARGIGDITRDGELETRRVAGSTRPKWQELIDKESDFLQKKNSVLDLQPYQQSNEFINYIDKIKSLNESFEKEIEDIKVMSKLYRAKTGEWAIVRCALNDLTSFKHDFDNIEDAFLDSTAVCDEIKDINETLKTGDCNAAELETREIILKKELNVLFEGMRAKAREHKITAAKLSAANTRATIAQGTLFKEFIDKTCESVNKVLNDRAARFDYDQYGEDILRAGISTDPTMCEITRNKYY